MKDLKKEVGEQIRAIRKEKGLTQRELGEKLGVVPSVIGGYEKGKQNLTLETLQKLAEGLGVEWLITHK